MARQSVLFLVAMALAIARAGFSDPLSPLCTNATIHFFSEQLPLNASEQVIQLMLASARNPGDSGNYFECHEDLGAQFCVVNAPFSWGFNGTTYFSLGNVNTGLCVPIGCNATDVATMAQDFYWPVLFSRFLNKSQVNSVNFLQPHELHGAGAYITVIILCLLAVMLVAGSANRVYKARVEAEKKRHLTVINGDTDDEPLLVDTKKDTPVVQMTPVQKPKETKWQQILNSFDIAENWADLKKAPGINNGLKALDGLRVCSMLWIILGHTADHLLGNADDYLVIARDVESRFTTQFVFNAVFAVDTFFFLSAFLASYLFLDSFAKQRAAEAQTGKKKREPNIFAWSGLVYFHRYLRLTPLYLVALMFWTYLLPLTFQGYFWNNFMVRRCSLACLADADAELRQWGGALHAVLVDQHSVHQQPVSEPVQRQRDWRARLHVVVRWTAWVSLATHAAAGHGTWPTIRSCSFCCRS